MDSWLSIEHHNLLHQHAHLPGIHSSAWQPCSWPIGSWTVNIWHQQSFACYIRNGTLQIDFIKFPVQRCNNLFVHGLHYVQDISRSSNGEPSTLAFPFGGIHLVLWDQSVLCLHRKWSIVFNPGIGTWPEFVLHDNESEVKWFISIAYMLHDLCFHSCMHTHISVWFASGSDCGCCHWNGTWNGSVQRRNCKHIWDR